MIGEAVQFVVMCGSRYESYYRGNSGCSRLHSLRPMSPGVIYLRGALLADASLVSPSCWCAAPAVVLLLLMLLILVDDRLLIHYIEMTRM